MHTYGHVMPGVVALSKIPVRLSKEAKQRLKWFDYYARCGNAALTCRRFGISERIFHKWKKRYNKFDLRSLEDKSRRPNLFRQSKLPWDWLMLIKKIRTQYPYYSKYKIMVILKRDHRIILSASTVGRIIKKYHLFFKSPYRSKKKRYASYNRQRLPKNHDIVRPGDLIESDMKHLPFLGQKRYCFVAIDCAGKGVAIRISTTPSSHQNSSLVDQTKANFPFPIKAWENDNGSENLRDFYLKLRAEDIPQYFTYPYCPKDKPFVERIIGTMEREFIQQGKLTSDLHEQQRLIDEWLDEYHNFRPHQSLGYLTPNEYYQKTLGRTVLSKHLPM